MNGDRERPQIILQVVLSSWYCCYGDFSSLPFIRGVQIELVVCVSELFVGSINQSLGAKRHGPTVGRGVYFCRCEMINFNELTGMGWARY